MNDMIQPEPNADLPDGLARVVRIPTLIKYLDEQCRKAWQSGGSAFPPSVCWILLDDMTSHREQLGFSGLEKLVHAVHERVRAQLDPADVTARFGLDAIGAILDAQRGDRDFNAIAETLLKAINNSLFEIDDQMIVATISIAIRPVRENLSPPEINLVSIAEAAENISAHGGNRSELSGASPGERPDGPATMLGQLTKALRDNSLKVVFQPLLATSGPERERAQLLPRLTGPDGSLIPAARFIPVAAERGVLPAVDHWMIGHAVELLKQQSGQGDAAPTYFVNQSPALIDDPAFVQWVREKVNGLELSGHLVLEFNILDLKPRIRDARRVLDRLRALGIGISLTGVDEKVPEAVLLKHLPADYIRMKADFARRVLSDKDLAERFEQFAAAARAAGRQLIVPMLEDAEEVSRVWQMDVDLIQGNFIQQPSEQPLQA